LLFKIAKKERKVPDSRQKRAGMTDGRIEIDIT